MQCPYLENETSGGSKLESGLNYRSRVRENINMDFEPHLDVPPMNHFFEMRYLNDFVGFNVITDQMYSETPRHQRYKNRPETIRSYN